MKALCLTQPDQGTDFLTALWLTKEHESRQICKLIHGTERTKRRLNFSSIEAETWSEKRKTHLKPSDHHQVLITCLVQWGPTSSLSMKADLRRELLTGNQVAITENYSSEPAEQSDHHWVFITSHRESTLSMKAPSNSVECCKWLNYIYLDARNSEVCSRLVNQQWELLREIKQIIPLNQCSHQ